MKKLGAQGTPKNKTILYLEARDQWHDVVGRILTRAGYEILLPANTAEAVDYHVEHEDEITVMLLGEVYGCSDNNEWADDLHQRGFRVIVLACHEAQYATSIRKGDDWHLKLLPTLEQVIARPQRGVYD